MQTNNSDNNWSELKILEPIKKYSKEFNTPDEFNLWYSKHKNEIDNETTHKLNKLYHIQGYRITKIKGVLMLKKWDEEKQTLRNPEIREELNQMKEAINSIIRYLKGDSQQTIEVSPPEITSTII